MEQLLRNEYPTHYKTTFKESYTIEINDVKDITLYISNQTNGITTIEDNEAVLKLENHNNYSIRIINIENYLKQYPSSLHAGKGKQCDLMILPSEETVYTELILAELTKSLPYYIEPYSNTKGYNQGKRASAFIQISETINKLMAVDAINTRIKCYKKSTGLFAYKLTQEETKNIDHKILQSINLFNAPMQIIATATQENTLPNGFIFKQQLFDRSYYFGKINSK